MTYTSITSSYLRDELERQRALFQAQPILVQHFLEAQAQRMAEALVGNAIQVRFWLPDRVSGMMPKSSAMASIAVPAELREQTVRGWTGLLRLQRPDLREPLFQRLSQLEGSPDQAVHTSASLLRHALVTHMLQRMLPAGRSVIYRADDGELIPNVPQEDGAKASAITASTDAIAEQGDAEAEHGDLQVPFAPAARRFYLPQWVALDESGKLLVNSVSEAESQLASMQRYVAILHKAVALAPYLVADDEYQRKRYGMLGQLVNQGRALARHKTEVIIREIQERAGAGKLNRGLSLSLPYFDDQELKMDVLDFDVIPGGRIMFKPVFVVRAANMEQPKVAQDTRMSPSTRKYLLIELEMLKQAFSRPGMLLHNVPQNQWA